MKFFHGNKFYVAWASVALLVATPRVSIGAQLPPSCEVYFESIALSLTNARTSW